MLEPLVKTIEVPCNQKKAFTVFMDMGSWWPKDKFATSVMRGQTVKALRVDAREGGQIVEVASDGHEQLWGTIKTYDPYGYLNMDFHIPHPTEKNPGFSTVRGPPHRTSRRPDPRRAHAEQLGSARRRRQDGPRRLPSGVGHDLRGCLQGGVWALSARALTEGHVSLSTRPSADGSGRGARRTACTARTRRSPPPRSTTRLTEWRTCPPPPGRCTTRESPRAPKRT